MSKQQSSIEFLVKELTKLGYLMNRPSPNVLKAIEQAKQLHKQEIIDAYLEGTSDLNIIEGTAMEYYKNTFKQE